jgi:hypothetical protein
MTGAQRLLRFLTLLGTALILGLADVKELTFPRNSGHRVMRISGLPALG